jgi:hypothetical protein
MAVAPQPPDWHLTETYKSLITLTVEALKMLALLNGGAAIAILTYLGNLASRQPAAVHLPDIKLALWCYSGGVAATTLAFIFAYATQLRLFIEERDRRGGLRRRTVHWVGVTAGVLLALGAAPVVRQTRLVGPRDAGAKLADPSLDPNALLRDETKRDEMGALFALSY